MSNSQFGLPVSAITLMRSIGTDNTTRLLSRHDLQALISRHSKNQYEATWPRAAYKTSKGGVVRRTETLAIENTSTRSKTLINFVCPRHVNTDMPKGRGAKTPDEGYSKSCSVARVW